MADLGLPEVALLTQQNRELLRELIGEFAALRGIVSDGLSIRDLPELPAPVVNVPQQQMPDFTQLRTDPSDIAAALAPLLNGSGGTEEQFREMKEILQSVAEKMANNQQRMTTYAGGSAGKIKNTQSSVIDPATSQDIQRLIDVAGRGQPRLHSDLDPLGASEQRVTEWYDASAADHILWFAFGDQALTELVVEWSDDGENVKPGLLGSTNWLDSETFTSGFYVYIDNATTLTAPFFRLKYTNGATPMAVFESYAWCGAPFAGTFLRPNEALSDLSLGLLTRSITAGTKPNGTFGNAVLGGPVTLTPTPTPLGAAQEYVSDWIASEGHISIEAFFDSDQLSADDGIVFEFTNDEGATLTGGKVRRTFSQPDIDNTGLFTTLQSRGNHFRVRWLNGGTPQGFIQIDLRLNPAQTESPKLPSDSKRSAGSAAAVGRTFVEGLNASGEYEDVEVLSSALKVAVDSFQAEVGIKPLTAFSTNQANVPTTAVQLVTAPLTDRKTVVVKNRSDSSKVIYIGNSSAVTASSGYELAAGEGIELDLAPGGQGIWAISAAGTQRATWLQIGGA